MSIIGSALYTTAGKTARSAVEQYFATHLNESTTARACSRDFYVHYSFDIAQQVHYPSDPLQPGPIYFLTTRKCAIFGVCCEAIPKQINYLVDECVDTGEGANTIVSKLHHFLHHHGLGEQCIQFHAHNCAGQNKKNTMVQ